MQANMVDYCIQTYEARGCKPPEEIFKKEEEMQAQKQSIASELEEVIATLNCVEDVTQINKNLVRRTKHKL